MTGLLGVEFRPRFATIHRQQLYSIDAVPTYREQNYRICPHARIDYENLVSQWDEVLRFVATIKLGYARASQLFKRLNSYDRQHPLYRALRDLGRLYKTEYILRYVDQPCLRQTVEGILTAPAARPGGACQPFRQSGCNWKQRSIWLDDLSRATDRRRLQTTYYERHQLLEPTVSNR